MKPTVLRAVLVVACLTLQIASVDIDLLNLKSQWIGKGNSFLYPRQMKLLSNKLTKQVGSMTTFTPFPAGKNWEIRGYLKLKCLNYKLLEREENDFGISFWLTKNNQRSGYADYNYDDYSGNFGMTQNIEGLSLIFYKNNLYTGLFKSDNLTRDDLINRSKVCKAYLEKEQEIRFAVKYRSNILGVYFTEQKDKIETLCFQFTEIRDFDQFYLSVGAFDRQSECSADLSGLSVSTEYTDYQFVPNDQKKPEEPTLSYFPGDHTADQKIQFDHFQKVYDYYRENAKIFAKQLLTFADKNEKELIADIKSEITNTEAAVDRAISVIEDQAKQIEALNNLLTTDRKAIGENVNALLDQILQWMSQMDEAFDKVETETESMYSILSKSNYDDHLEKLLTKAQTVGRGLIQVLKKTSSIKENQDINDMEEGRIQEWSTDIFNFFKDAKSAVSKNTVEKTSRLRTIGLFLLGSIAVAIIISFLVMYLKIKKAMRYKRIL